MCIPLTPVLLVLITVINIIHLSCFTESVSLRDMGKPTSRAEITSPSCLYLKAVKGAQIGSALDDCSIAPNRRNTWIEHFLSNTTSLEFDKKKLKFPSFLSQKFFYFNFNFNSRC